MGIFSFLKGDPKKWYRKAVQTHHRGIMEFAARYDAMESRQAGCLDVVEIGRLVVLDLRRETIECLDRALQLDSSFALAWLAKGELLLLNGDFDQSRLCLVQAITADPGLSDAHCCLGEALDGLGAFELACACYDRAIELNSADAEAWGHRSRHMSRVGKEELAKTCADKARSFGWESSGKRELRWIKHNV